MVSDDEAKRVEQELAAMPQWRRHQRHTAISASARPGFRARHHELWRGAQCQFCGARWPDDEPAGLYPLRYLPAEGTVCCARGFGCASLRASDLRILSRGEVRSRERWARFEFRWRGEWLSFARLAEIAEANGVGRKQLRDRLYDGWSVDHAIAPRHATAIPNADRLAKGKRASYERARFEEITCAGAKPVARNRRTAR